MRLHWLTVLVGVAIMICGTGFAQEHPVEQAAPLWEDEVLAVVDGKSVTRKQIWWEMEQGWGGEVLDDLITGMLVAAEAERQGIKVAGPEVDAELARIKAGYDSEAKFVEMLHARGQTLKGFRITMQRDLVIEKLLAKRMGVDDAGLREYHDTHREEFARPKKVHLYDIVALTLTAAYAARERLAAGERFSAVASDVSNDPTAKTGGDRGWLTREDVLCANAVRAVFALEMGEVSDPIMCEDHCHVFFAAGVKPRELLSFEEARPEIIRALRDQRGISKNFYLTLLKRDAQLDVSWPALGYMERTYADFGEVSVVVDGERLALPRTARILANGHLIVPASALLTALGGAIEYDSDTGLLEVTREEMRMRLMAGLDVLAIGSEERMMKEAPVIEDGTMMISPRGPVEALGGSLLWNREDNALYVKSGGGATVE